MLNFISWANAPAGDNQAPRARTTIGVGETVTMSANRRATWSTPGVPRPGHHEEIEHQFTRLGEHTVTAQNGRERFSITFNVVAPSVRVSLISVEPGLPHVADLKMLLNFRLTPLSVSFGKVQFRELDCGPHEVWGCYLTLPPYERWRLNHVANPLWSPVNEKNFVTGVDRAGYLSSMNEQLAWPVTPGGFKWAIPNEFRLDGGQPHRIAVDMVQSFRLEPAVGVNGGAFRGALFIDKGGQRTMRIFP